MWNEIKIRYLDQWTMLRARSHFLLGAYLGLLLFQYLGYWAFLFAFAVPAFIETIQAITNSLFYLEETDFEDSIFDLAEWFIGGCVGIGIFVTTEAIFV